MTSVSVNVVELTGSTATGVNAESSSERSRMTPVGSPSVGVGHCTSFSGGAGGGGGEPGGGGGPGGGGTGGLMFLPLTGGGGGGGGGVGGVGAGTFVDGPPFEPPDHAPHVRYPATAFAAEIEVSIQWSTL